MKKQNMSGLLALIILLSLLVVGVGAAEGDTLNACGPVGFNDADKITYTKAVAVTGGLGLFSGTADGNFDPTGTVTRAQMATIVVKMLKGSDFNADAYKGDANPFPDTAAFQGGWAEGYINVCAQMGIVKGYGNGTFQPANPVTSGEALTMVLNALRVNAGEGKWPATVMNKAAELNLSYGLKDKIEAGEVLNREQLAVIVNAGVQYKPQGGESLLSSVFSVDKINANHQFSDANCQICGVAKASPLTREDLEKAVVETAFAYMMKGDKLQYCSQVLNEAHKFYWGHYRVTEDKAPEFGTTDTTLYSVCSDWVGKVYLHALDHRLMNGTGPLNGITKDMWRCAENQPDGKVVKGTVDPISDNNVDFTVMRWMSYKYKFDDTAQFLGVDKSPYFANFGDYHLTFENGYYPTTDEEFAAHKAAAKAFLYDWENNLRPGDVFCANSHALLYVGNGYVLDCLGYKYNPNTGEERFEPQGAVYRMRTVASIVSQYFKGSNDRFIVLRPSKAMVDTETGVVSDPTYTLPTPAVSREKFPAMEIDRTASAKPYTSVASGEEVTYSVKITNCSNHDEYVKYHIYSNAAYAPADYKSLPVTETVPAGTEFVRATGDYMLENGKLSWTVDVPVGRTVEVTYTVQVTALMGDTIVNDGGFVDHIPSNTLENVVGGKKLNEQALSALKDIADTNPDLWNEKFNLATSTDLDFAESIYEEMGIKLDLPTIKDLVNEQFEWNQNKLISSHFSYSTDDYVHTFKAYMMQRERPGNGQTLRDMLVENYWGGYRYFTGAAQKGTTINEMRVDYLEPGDILVYVDADNKTGVPENSSTLVYAGQNSMGEHTLLSRKTYGKTEVFIGEGADARLWGAFMNSVDLFFVLRPTQCAYESMT